MALKLSVFVIFVHLIILGDVSDGSFSLFPGIFGQNSEESDNDIDHGFRPKLIKIFYPVYRIQYPNNLNEIQQENKSINIVNNSKLVKHQRPNLIKFETLPKNVINELPDDLMQLAGSLGINDLSQIPSLTEMSTLLGTQTPQETIDFIRQFAKTDEGLDFIRAFINSNNENDETDENIENKVNEIQNKPKSATGRTLSSSSSPKFESYVESAETDLEILGKVLTTPKPELGFLGRISSYLNVFDTNSDQKKIPLEPFSLPSLTIQSQQRHQIGSTAPSQSNIAYSRVPHQQVLYRPQTKYIYRPPYSPITPVYNPSPKRNLYLPYRHSGIISINTDDKFQKPIRVIPTQPTIDENKFDDHFVSAQDINEIVSDNVNFISSNDKRESIPETLNKIQTSSIEINSHKRISQPIVKNSTNVNKNIVPKSVADLQLVDQNWTSIGEPKNSYGTPILQWPISFDVKSRKVKSKTSNDNFNSFKTDSPELVALLQGPVFKREEEEEIKDKE